MRSKKKRGFYGIMVDEGTVERFVGAGFKRRDGKATAEAKKGCWRLASCGCWCMGLVRLLLLLNVQR